MQLEKNNDWNEVDLHGKNKYWEIYLTVLDFWTGQIFPKILYTFHEDAQNFIEKIKECPRLIQAQSKNEILLNFIVKFLKNLQKGKYFF